MRSLLALAVALALAACAAQPTPSGSAATAATGASEDKDYRTGSRLPRREPAAAAEVAAPATPAPKM